MAIQTPLGKQATGGSGVAEVAVQNGAKLGTLTERINEEHEAHETGIKTALGHFEATLERDLDAGDLLLQAKAEHEHGTWVMWVEANF
jgi:hypothetical protein